MECVSGFWHWRNGIFCHYPCIETIFGLSCVVFLSSCIITITHEHAETPAISKTWGIGLAIVTMIVWWMKLQLLGFCWSIGYPELVSILTFRKLIPNSTFHHCHPSQVRTSQHITQPTYRIFFGCNQQLIKIMPSAHQKATLATYKYIGCWVRLGLNFDSIFVVCIATHPFGMCLFPMPCTFNWYIAKLRIAKRPHDTNSK